MVRMSRVNIYLKLRPEGKEKDTLLDISSDIPVFIHLTTFE